MILIKRIRYFGQEIAVACDGRCDKAWGRSSRPRADELGADLMADDELETAPADPGSIEGTDIKPRRPEDRLNKWCVRECERSVIPEVDFDKIAMGDDFTKRVRLEPVLVCKCGWRGRVDDQDALGTECGCCPQCGNEDLEFEKEANDGD